MPKKPKWRRKLEKKLREFVSICITALFIFLVGAFSFPTFAIIYDILTLTLLFIGTLAILGLTEEN